MRWSQTWMLLALITYINNSNDYILINCRARPNFMKIAHLMHVLEGIKNIEHCLFITVNITISACRAIF
jgi:hypothetical protein